MDGPIEWLEAKQAFIMIFERMFITSHFQIYYEGTNERMHAAGYDIEQNHKT